MYLIDWVIVGVMLAIVAGISLYTQRYVRGVSDFLSAGRVAGRYVVAVSNGEAAMGLISMVAFWELYYNSGFALAWWQAISAPILLVVTLTGYCFYRFRETRAMTMGQLLEIRYSRRFRIFAGSLSALSGIVNYGLFPAVGARFIVYFCGMPQRLEFFGTTWPTFGVVMALFLALAATMAMLGGQLTIMTSDCVMGILSYPIYLVVVFCLLSQFSWWREIAPALSARPAGESMLNPFDTENLRDFNIFYVFVGILALVYGGAGISWLGTQGYNSAARNAHEQKMGRILSTWRTGFSTLMIILTAAVAYTYIHDVGYADRAKTTQANLTQSALEDVAPEFLAARSELDPALPTDARTLAAALESEEPATFQTYSTIREQMLVPAALRDILPAGVLGGFCALMIFLMVSTDTTYMHSWGSILVQDIYLPCRKKPLKPEQQLTLLRVAIFLVAVYAFLFSLFFGQVTYILMFFALTGSIWAGAGAVIVLGLYWSRGTTAGAWASLITGAVIALGGLVLTNFWVSSIYPILAHFPSVLSGLSTTVETISRPMEPIILWRVTPDQFFINGQEVSFITMVGAIAVYVGVSLLTFREKFNMDKMLHRGDYERPEDAVPEPAIALARTKGWRSVLRALSGIDQQFTRGDKILSYSVLIYSLGWGFIVSFLAILAWNLVSPWSHEYWVNWFFVSQIVVPCVIGVVSSVWFFVGGSLDLSRMFKLLKAHRANEFDDGRIVDHMNADDFAIKLAENAPAEDSDR